MDARYDRYLRGNRQRHLDELMTFMKFKTISPGHDPSNREEAAGWLRDKIQQQLDPDKAILIKGDGSHAPLVYAEWLKAGADQPTVLVYCHYDVMPPGDGWRKDLDPFVPKIEDNVLWGRGSCDDKGQLWMQLKAIETLLHEDGKLPVNIKCIFEGEEEAGSQWITEVLTRSPQDFKCDALVISDTDFYAEGVPSITNGLRGLVGLTGKVIGPNRNLHSGLYGGSVKNPLEALGDVIAALKAKDGVIQVPHFYDDVVELTPEQRDEWAGLPFSYEKYAADLGVTALYGEQGYTTLERLWARPTLEINAFTGGDAEGAGITTAIPPEASFKITCRLVPNQNPERIRELVIEHMHNVLPVGVTLQTDPGPTSAAAVLMRTRQPAATAAVKALEAAFEAETCPFIRSGGSVPVIATMQKAIGVDPVLLGFGLPDDNIHGPNEHFKLNQFDRGLRALCEFWNNMAKAT